MLHSFEKQRILLGFTESLLGIDGFEVGEAVTQQSYIFISTAKIFVVLAKSIFEQILKSEHLVRCQKIHICCVDKANIWWDDKKWFYQEMWKEIYLMCQQNICRDHKDICCVNTQQRMGNRHQLDVSLVWWRHDHCTKICKIPKISNVSLHKSPKSSRSPLPAFYLLVILSVGWKSDSIYTCSVVLFSKCWPFQ